VNKPTVEIPSVDWWITSQCNLSCDFCYGPDPEEKDPVGLRAGILEALEESSARVVTFCGGEPLLVKEISEYAATLKQHGKAAVLNTNGQLLSQRVDPDRGGPKIRLADFAMVGISVDGSTPDMHYMMRRGRGKADLNHGRGKADLNHGRGKADLNEVLAAARLVASEPGVRLKIATVVSSVNKEDLPALARTVREIPPDIWRLYQYSSRGSYNLGQERHRLADDEFQRLVRQAADLVAPVRAAPSTEAETEGCLIVDMSGNVLQPTAAGYAHLGNCLKESLDDIWAELPARSTIINNKRWLSVLG
jgi:MoaA/NifB/PqqE/SkfB family radical SAM enzyme